MEYFRVGFGGGFGGGRHLVGYGHPGFGHSYHHPYGYGPRLWNRPYGYGYSYPYCPYCDCFPYETEYECQQKRINNGCLNAT
jgi:hypothetical protein